MYLNCFPPKSSPFRINELISQLTTRILGLGYRTALGLAGRGCRIIIADKDNSEKSKELIIKTTGNKNILTKYLNLSSFESIRTFAADINKTEERLDILINNAGCGVFTTSRTKDGCNTGMQVNHFGSFLLTHLLVGEYFQISNILLILPLK